MRVNEAIRAPQVRLIDENGAQIGIVSKSDALSMAKERGFDLVEVSAESRPPVCRIMDYGKFVYDLQKKAKTAKKKQHTIQLKEVRFRPKIEEHDYDFKLKHIVEFLQQGFKIKIMVRFKGRELVHKELGFKVIERLEADIAQYGRFEIPGKMEQRSITGVIAPMGAQKPVVKEKESDSLK